MTKLTIEQQQQLTRHFFLLFYSTLRALVPHYTRFNEPHPYATGATKSSIKITLLSDNKYRIKMGNTVFTERYTNLAMGYNDAGGKRKPRGRHEVNNFKVIETCIHIAAAKIQAEAQAMLQNENGVDDYDTE